MHETGEPHVHEEEVKECCCGNEERHEHTHDHHDHDHDHDHDHHHDHDHEHHHDHDHHHDHEHPHTHDHDHEHEHTHEHPHQQEVTPKALLSYMVDHNRSHLTELEQVAGTLSEEAQAQIKNAVELIRKGNEELAKVLDLV